MSSANEEFADIENESVIDVDNKNKNSAYCCLCLVIKWFFEPICTKIGYSLKTMLFQPVNFGIALGMFIFVITGLGLTIGLSILCVGLITFYLTCEISLLIARMDLCISFHLVENNETLIKKRSNNLQVALNSDLPSCCPCCCCLNCCACMDSPSINENNNNNNNKNDGSVDNFCGIMWKRMKMFYTSCATYGIFLYFILIKPIITSITCWTFFLVVYAGYLFIIPFWYLIHNHLFKNGTLCPFGYSSHNDNGFRCHGFQVDNFGAAFLCFLVGLLTLPIACRINNYSAQLSKVITYYSITKYYKYGICNCDKNSYRQLLYDNNV